jgi:hypothetical protein
MNGRVTVTLTKNAAYSSSLTYINCKKKQWKSSKIWEKHKRNASIWTGQTWENIDYKILVWLWRKLLGENKNKLKKTQQVKQGKHAKIFWPIETYDRKWKVWKMIMKEPMKEYENQDLANNDIVYILSCTIDYLYMIVKKEKRLLIECSQLKSTGTTFAYVQQQEGTATRTLFFRCWLDLAAKTEKQIQNSTRHTLLQKINIIYKFTRCYVRFCVRDIFVTSLDIIFSLIINWIIWRIYIFQSLFHWSSLLSSTVDHLTVPQSRLVPLIDILFTFSSDTWYHVVLTQRFSCQR